MNIWDEIINSNKKKNQEEIDKDGSGCSELGTICPQCQAANLEYDGKLNLVCPACGYETDVGFT
ncbi:MAG: hypothetical protein J7K66_06275 [Anaerolineaceae bacterium]|nr:hypothetical protein [Anaerolineaceae bacterium]